MDSAAVTNGPLYLVIGGPAVGKSSAGRALASSFDRGVHLPVDDLREFVVSGLVEPSAGGWSEELAAQVSLARNSALQMADRYRAAGFAVVIDDFLDPHLLTEYRHLENRGGVVPVVLRPAEEEARRRNRIRAGSEEERIYIDGRISAVYGLLEEHGQQLADRGWSVIDNTDLTVAETAAAIRSAGSSVGLGEI